jgi:transcriptional regulator with XRE-family HTH domain
MVTGGRRLQGRRADLGLTVEEVAELCHVSATTVRRYEAGTSSALRPGISRRLADALRVRSLSALYLEGDVQVLGVER